MDPTNEQKPGRKVQVNLKFSPNAATGRPAERLERVLGVQKVTQTFPDARNEALATLYVVEINPDGLDRALTALRGLEGVEYVEWPAPRKLIRPVKER